MKGRKVWYSKFRTTLVCSFIQYRTQAVDVDGNISSFNNLAVGVHQCAVLGPLLFLIFIDELHARHALHMPYMYMPDS